MAPKSKKKPPQNVCSIFFQNKGVEFINIARMLCDPDIYNLDLDLFLTNSDSIACKCNNSPFVDRHDKYIVTGDLRNIRNNVLRKLFIKGHKYREVRPINQEKAKRCI